MKNLAGGKWFLRAWPASPGDAAGNRVNTVLVDSGHSPANGNASVHRFEVDSDTATVSGKPVWRAYVSGTTGGDWAYPTVENRTATFRPSLAAPGRYRVSVGVRGDSLSKTVTYTVKSSSGSVLASKAVAQYRSPAAWVRTVIADDVTLSNGAYVEAAVPAQSNVDSIKFTWLGPAQTSCQYPCSAYSFGEGVCSGGWHCPCGSACLVYTGCTNSTSCSVPTKCPSGSGAYCGESVGLTASTLYNCSGGVFTKLSYCPAGCKVSPPGYNDKCL